MAKIIIDQTNPLSHSVLVYPESKRDGGKARMGAKVCTTKREVIEEVATLVKNLHLPE